ncbi:hypothetical protein SLEP1_g31460 [Rubroshorea leprosula]|uniref:PAZ domain-containing protein n=1 Tax=Rubroshorea leprosula TaxID=152421 RepID=A0AAV5K3E2_9ROSI|nr:hypothetical protein SLEP1_g31460 [Rubroshorea leprosula]
MLLLAATGKYLYLLFDDSFMVVRKYIFTTEGHPLPVLRSWHERLPETYIPTNWTYDMEASRQRLHATSLMLVVTTGVSVTMAAESTQLLVEEDHIAILLDTVACGCSYDNRMEPDSLMVRKRRTELPSSAAESSETQEASGASGHGSQHPAEGSAPQQGGYQGGHQSRRGWPPQQAAHGGFGGGHGRGGPQQQPYGGQPEYQSRGRGGPPTQVGRGGYGGGRGSGGMGGEPGGHGGGPSSGGPSRQPNPELHQATVPHQAVIPTQPSPSVASSSSTPADVTQHVQQLTIHQEAASAQEIQPAPLSSKSMSLPLRPGKGSYGTKCIVKANHFFVKLPDKNLHQYDVTITPEVTSRVVNRDVVEKLVELYRESHLGKRLPVYDGRKSLYTAGPLPFSTKEFRILLGDEDDGSGAPRRKGEFKVIIEFAARADLHQLRLFLEGRQADAPQEALKVLGIVLRKMPNTRYCPVGRSFYSPNLGRRQPLGEGLESWRVAKSGCFLWTVIQKALRGVKVEVTHRGYTRRKYRISGLTSQATTELTFPVDEIGTVKSVLEYFYETYGFTIQHTQFPCLQVGSQNRPNYLPMEVCKIAAGQRYSKRLNNRQITALLKVTCQRPHERETDILQTVSHNAYHEDPYAKEFGIKISEQLASVEARTLPAPRVEKRMSSLKLDNGI